MIVAVLMRINNKQMKRKGAILILMFCMIGFNNGFAKDPNIIVFTKTNGFEHECIPAAVAAIEKLSLANNWNIIITNQDTIFNHKQLQSIDLIILVSPTGDIFNAEAEKAIEQFVERDGKNLLTVHSGTDAEYDWQWYQNAIGARFMGHPPVQKGTIIIEDRNNPSTAIFPDDTWMAEDEWYSFFSNPRDKVHVLISMDESSYDVDNNPWFPGKKLRMNDHPLVWYKELGEGIVYQSALGHPIEMYSNPIYLKHLKGAIDWLLPN